MLHLMKLAVGVRDPAHLRSLQSLRVSHDLPLRHVTRQMPRRAAEIAGAGSLYWVVAGTMLVRQPVLDIVATERADGTACAAIMLGAALVAVEPRPVRAFQGWRYLRAEEAPADLRPDSPGADLPAALARDLRALCLL